MTAASLRARWQALPAWARWPLAYVALVGASALLGWPTIGAGNAIFVTGAALVASSLFYIRHGGRRKMVVARAMDGKPLKKDWMPESEREREIRKGIGLFLLGFALWATLLVPLAFGAIVP